MAVMVWHMKFIFLAKITRQSKLAALKIETEQPPRFNNVKNELDIFNACSELVISKKCINFLVLYGVFKINDKQINRDVTSPHRVIEHKHDSLTYGAVMTKADSDAYVLLRSPKLKLLDIKQLILVKKQIFWQIAFALYACRTFNIYHNDAHLKNIFIRKISKDCTLVYKNTTINKCKTIKLKAGDYYAMLGDFGLCSTNPICLEHEEAMTLVVKGNYSYVSDLSRLATAIFNGYYTPKYLAKLYKIWLNMARNIEFEVTKSPKTVNDLAITRELVSNHTLAGLYRNEIQVFEKIAFDEDILPYYDLSTTIICDITLHQYPKEIEPIKLCEPDSLNVLCMWLSTHVHVRDTNKLCKLMSSESESKLPSASESKLSKLPSASESKLSKLPSNQSIDELIKKLKKERYQTGTIIKLVTENRLKIIDGKLIPTSPPPRTSFISSPKPSITSRASKKSRASSKKSRASSKTSRASSKTSRASFKKSRASKTSMVT